MKLSKSTWAVFDMKRSDTVGRARRRNQAKRSLQLDHEVDVSLPWKGKARAVDEPASDTYSVAEPYQHVGASTSRVTLDMVRPSIGGPSGAAPMLQARAKEDPLADHPFSLRHNLPMLLLVIVGSIVVFAMLVTSLACLLRCCCGWDRRSKKRLNRAFWSPSVSGGSFSGPHDEKVSALKESDAGLVMPTEPLPVLLGDTQVDGSNRPPSYASNVTKVQATEDADRIEVAQGAKPSADGRGWSLYDNPSGNAIPVDKTNEGQQNVRVNMMQLPEAFGGFGAGFPDLEGGRTHLPARRPSLIDRVMKQRGTGDFAAEPTKGYGACPLPLQPGSARPNAAASRFAGIGVHASRTVLSMIPATLRNAASTSRPRVLGGRNAANDSDFEGTIGGRDRDLPKAKRIGKKAERFTMDCSTEEEQSPEGFGTEGRLEAFGHHRAMASPGGRLLFTGSPAAGQRLEFTPGLAGIGAAWPSKRNSANTGLARLIEMEEAAMRQGQLGDGLNALQDFASAAQPQAPAPALDYQRALLEQRLQWEAYMMGQPMPDAHALLQQSQAIMMAQQHIEGRQRLVSSVSRWQEAARDAEPVYDPYTSAPPSVRGSIRGRLTNVERSRSCRSATSGVTVSDVTSISEGSSVTGLSAFFQGKGAAGVAPTLRPGEDEQISRVPSIRPQFAATTTLSSWLEPAQVSTTHGLKANEDEHWEDIEGDDKQDPFASDVDVEPRRRSMLGYLNSESEDSQESDDCAEVALVLQPQAKSGRRDSRSKLAGRRPSDAVRTKPARTAVRGKRSAKSGYSSPTSGKRPAYERHSSHASSMRSAHTRMSVRSSAAQSTAASSNLSSLFDAEPRHLRASKKDKQARDAVMTGGEDGKKSSRSRRRDVAAAEPVGEDTSALSENSSAPTRADSSYTADAADRKALKRQESNATMASFYSELTAPEEYSFQAPLLASEAAAVELKKEVKKKPSNRSLASDSSASIVAEPRPTVKQRMQPSVERESKRRQREAEAQDAVARADERESKPRSKRDATKPRNAVASGDVIPSSRRVSAPREPRPAAQPTMAEDLPSLSSRKESRRPRHPAVTTVEAEGEVRSSRRSSSRPTADVGASRRGGAASAGPSRAPSTSTTVAAAIGQCEKRVRSHGSRSGVGAARARTEAEYDESDSPWTSSDSDISLRRWGASNEAVQSLQARRSSRR